MLTDLNKGITSIKYNHLNLPTQISFANGNSIQYLYNATGQKVKKTVTDGSTITTTDYLDGFQYINTILEFFPTAEGYVKATSISLNPNAPLYVFNYVYNHTDHLGNVRVSYAKDPQTGSVKILDENHYYPFGLKHTDYNTQGLIKHDDSVIIAPIANNPFKYKYNGKELQNELGLNMYDMEMRQYDPAIARWVVMDPVIHHSMSPYNAFDNNPVFWADPSGADAEQGSGGGDTSGGNSSSDNYSGYSTGVTLAFGVSLNSVINSGAAVSFSGNLQSTGRKERNQNSNNGDPPTGDPKSKTREGSPENPVLLDETVIKGYQKGGVGSSLKQAIRNSFELPEYVKNAYKNSYDQRFSPPNFDGFSFKYGISSNGFFGRGNMSVGFVVEGGDIGITWESGGGWGLRPEIPSFNTGFEVSFHNNYGGNTSVIDGVQRLSQGYEGSIVFGGGFSQSAIRLSNGSIGNADAGVKSVNVNLGVGYGFSRNTSYTRIFRLSNLFK